MRLALYTTNLRTTRNDTTVHFIIIGPGVGTCILMGVKWTYHYETFISVDNFFSSVGLFLVDSACKNSESRGK